MALHREEATTNGRNGGRPVCLDVSVIVCDAEDCDETYLVGPGDGCSLSDQEFKEIDEAGWKTSDEGKDFCPAHADLAGESDENDEDDCECEFDPFEDGDEPSTHFKRTCGHCGHVWWSLHCPHDGIQKPCPKCKTIAKI